MARGPQIALINKLLDLDMGESGRLEYLKSAYLKGAHIYECDKKYLEKLKEKLVQKKAGVITNRSVNNTYQITSNNLSLMQNSEITKKNGSQDSEVMVNAMLNEIRELKKAQHKTIEKLQVVTSKLEHSEIKNEIKQNDTNQKWSSLSDKSLNESITVLTWSAAGLSVFWYAGFLNLVNFGSLGNVLLGISIGLAAGVGCLLKLKKRNKNSK